MFKISKMFINSLSFICIMLLIVSVSLAAAEEKGDDLRSAVQNPISSLISLPFKFTFDYGAPNGEASFLNIQPVIPVTKGDWNLVNRAIIREYPPKIVPFVIRV